ncbi:MAG: ABC transporter substrate-binding protein [Candidatus Thorarchaeota archaeon]
MNKTKRASYVIIALLLFFPMIGAPAVAAQDDAVMEFVMAYPSDLAEQNPIFARSARSTWYDMLVYDTLISYNDNLEKIPWLAESWTVSTDGTEVTFTIREGVTWHDGEAFTPADVVFTFNHHKDALPDANYWSLLQHATSITATGQVVTVVFDEPFAFAVDNLGSMHLLPEHIRSGVAADDASWDDPDNVTAHIGSGPFKFVSRVPDEFIQLERNDDWWGPDNPYVGQLPNIEDLRIDVVLGQDARILAMRSGAADSERYEVYGAYVTSILTAPELQLVTGVASQWDYVIGFNTEVAPFNDTDVRDAIALGIDRTELINIGRLGFGTQTNSSIANEFHPGFYDSDGAFPVQDVQAAIDLLNATYDDLDDDGFFDGLEFELLALSWDDISVATCTGLKLQLANIGIDVTVAVTDDGPMYDAIYVEQPDGGRDFQAYSMSHGLSPVPDHVWWRAHSDNIIDWGDNCYLINESSVDQHLDDFMGATPATVLAAAAQVQADILEYKPYIPLYLSDDTHAMRAEWVNFTTPPGGPFTDFNPRTMVFMYDSGFAPTTPTPTGGVDIVLILGIGAGALIVGVVVTYFLMRRR